jgi:hypothetical protein
MPTCATAPCGADVNPPPLHKSRGPQWPRLLFLRLLSACPDKCGLEGARLGRQQDRHQAHNGRDQNQQSEKVRGLPFVSSNPLLNREQYVGRHESPPTDMGNRRSLELAADGKSVWDYLARYPDECCSSEINKRGHPSFQKGPVAMERGQYPRSAVSSVK